MGIPYGTKYTAVVRGSTFNEVECENCKTAFVYQVEREASASGTSVLWLDNQGAKDRSNQAAGSALEDALKDAIDPVACPRCGWFQADMCKLLKRRRLQLGLVVSLAIAVVLLIWGQMTRSQPGNNSTMLIIASVCIGVVGGLASVIWSVFHKPNQSHPGPDGENQKTAAKSKGIQKADLEAAHVKAREAWEERFHRYLLQTMLQMSSVDGSIDESELQGVSKIYQQATGDEISCDDLRRKFAEQGATKEELLQNLNQFSADLTDEAKDLYIRAGVAIAAADGEFEPREWEFLLEVAKALEITKVRFESVLEKLKTQ